MKKKNYLIFVLVSALVLGLTACGGSGSSAQQNTAEESSEQNEEAAEPSDTEDSAEAESPAETAETPVEETAEAPAGEASPEDENGEIHIGFGYLSGDTLNRTILENMAEELKKEGIILDFAEAADADSMYIYLSNKGSGYDMAFGIPGAKYDTNLLQPAGYTACYNYRLYSTKYSSVDEIQADDRIGIYMAHYQNDLRVQMILEAAGIITLPNGPSVPLNENDVELHVKEIATGTDYNMMLENLPNMGAVLMPGIVMSYNSIFEDPTFDDPQFWGTILVRSEDLEDPVMRDVIKKVVAAYHCDFTAMSLFQSDSHAEPVGWDKVLID